MAPFCLAAMDYNANNPLHRQRIDRWIEFHRKRLEPFRRDRVQMVRAFAGAYYGDGEHKQTYANFMLQTGQAYAQAVSMGNPRVFGDTDDPSLVGFAARFAATINNLLVEIRFAKTLEQIALDSFFGLGIAYVHQADDAYVELEADVWADPGRPFVQRLSLDEFVFDTMVSDFRFAQLSGNMYRLDYDDLTDSDRFDQKVVRQINPSSKNSHPENSDRARDIAMGRDTDEDEYRPSVDLVDLYFAKEGRRRTFACHPDMRLLEKPPLADEPWDDGPEAGPYKLLNTSPVPDNVMPASMAAQIFNLHRMAQSLWRRMNNQSKRAKVNPIYTPAGKEDADRQKRAQDGEWIMVKAKEQVGVLTVPGVDQTNMVFEQYSRSMLDRMAGNLKAKAGLGPQSGTAAQDRMIAGEVSAEEDFLLSRVAAFVEEVASDLGKLAWKHPTRTDKTRVYDPGARQMRMVAWKSPDEPDARRGDVGDYKIRLNPYSLASPSPMAKAAELRGLVAECVQLIPLLEQAGGDSAEYIAELAEKYCQPALLSIFNRPLTPGRFPPEEQPPGGMLNQNKPNGNYTRTNVSRGPADGELPSMMGAGQEMAGGVT